MSNRKYIDSIRVHFPASYVRLPVYAINCNLRISGTKKSQNFCGCAVRPSTTSKLPISEHTEVSKPSGGFATSTPSAYLGGENSRESHRMEEQQFLSLKKFSSWTSRMKIPWFNDLPLLQDQLGLQNPPTCLSFQNCCSAFVRGKIQAFQLTRRQWCDLAKIWANQLLVEKQV